VTTVLCFQHVCVFVRSYKRTAAKNSSLLNKLYPIRER